MYEYCVSVIIPVYNAEKYIVPCMESLLLQTLSNIELIFVDDCSTDNSGKMLDLIAEKYPNKVHVIHLEENHGAGGARNFGVDIAKGEYIGFVDIDDVVTRNMFEKLYAEAKKNDYDVVDCGFYYEAYDTAIIYTSDALTGNVSNMTNQKKSELIVSGGYLWSKIYKAEFWHNNNFIFREHAILEDSEIVAKIYATMSSIGNVKEILYNYKNNDGSLTKEIETMKYYNNCFAAMKAIYEQLSVLANYEEIKEAVEFEILQLYSFGIIKLLDSVKKNENINQKELLLELAAFRNKYISAGYNNKYVRSKIDKTDIDIMKLNDTSPEKLIKAII